MKIFTNKEIIKKISLLLVVVILMNVFIPFSSYAKDEDEENGGKLFKPIFKMFAWVGDLVISGLQKIFIGDGTIKVSDGIKEIESGTFSIRYSPAIIFSGTVPGLDANFIKPEGNKPVEKVEISWSKVKDLDIDSDRQELINDYGFTTTIQPRETTTDGEHYLGIIQVNAENKHIIYEWNHNGKGYCLVDTYAGDWSILDSGMGITDHFLQMGIDGIQAALGTSWSLYERNTNTTVTGEYLKSTAGELQKTISTWYKALRLFALVGLLSVLVYIGIRILISSTGQEKSKYKKMIGDWIAAICILFVLQYIMSFTMTIVEEILNIFTTNVIEANGEDILMTNIRQKIATSNQYSTIFTDLIMYLALVILTVVFTIHYLKRLVYLAFFTMIAPMIALTYPLDKIKDGQAQAFGMWIKEYVFNALIPVVHIILYYIFVGTAVDFAESNPLYAIVCIAFLIPAEKFIRKMFGFDKATTSGQLGAAAGGAMIMNAVNKMGQKAPKGGQEEKQNKVRTTGGYSNGGGYSGGGYSGGGAPTGGANPPPIQGPQPYNGQPLGPAQTPGTNPPLTTPLSGSNLTGGTPATWATPSKAPKTTISGVGKGIKGVGKKYINRKTPKKIGKLLRRGLTKSAGAVALGTLGLAAGVASGDLGNVAKYTGTGLMAGSHLGKNLGDAGAKLEKQNRDAYRKGRLGKDEYNKQETIKQIWQNDDIYKQYKDGRKKADKAQFEADVREFMDNGVTDKDEIIAAMQLKDNPDYNLTNRDTVTIAQLNKKISNSTFGDPTKKYQYQQDIATSLRNQGFQGDVDIEAQKQIRLIGDMKRNLDNL